MLRNEKGKRVDRTKQGHVDWDRVNPDAPAIRPDLAIEAGRCERVLSREVLGWRPGGTPVKWADMELDEVMDGAEQLFAAMATPDTPHGV